MFERFLAVPLHFTIEFLGLLVLAGGAVLVTSRPNLIPGSKANRFAAALGLGALAIAQVLHGGSFAGAELDSAQLLVALKTLGMALVLIGVAGGARATAAAIAQAPGTSVDLLQFAPTISAAAVALMSLASSYRGYRALRRLALGAVMLGIAEAVIPLATESTGARLGDRYELISHALRTAGYMALAAWLWTGVRSSIRTRFVASFVTLLVLVVLALSSALTGVISNNVEEEVLDRVARQIKNVERGISETDLQAIAQEARLGASQTVVVEGSARGADHQALLRGLLGTGLFEADAALLTDPKGRLLGSEGSVRVGSRKPRAVNEKEVALILGAAPVQAVVNSAIVTESADIAKIGNSAARIGVSEVRAGDGTDRVVGVFALVDFMDILSLEEIAQSSATPASLIVGGKIVATTLNRDVTAAELVSREVKDELAISDDGVVALRQELGGSTYYSAISELESEDGFDVGYLALSARSGLVANTQANVTRTLFLVALSVGAIVLVLAYYSGRRITRPIQALTTTAQRIREGDLKAQAEVEGEDEVGQLGETFNEMTSSLFRMTNDLREAAREEHDLRARIETIIQSMADGLVAVDADRNVLAFNREAEQLTGIAASKAIGSPIGEILDARDAQDERVTLPIFDLAEGSVSGIFIKKGTDSIPVSVVSAALRDEEGETAGGVAVLRDMTREREVEKMKSEFLSNISHELRTPLTPIKGYAEIMERKEIPREKAKQFTRGILDSTAKLERIVELLVDFAALEAGRLSPRTASVDVAGIVEALATQWEARTPRHTVVAEVSARLPKVIGDERLLRRSFEEIIDNAVKFSPQGGTIRLQVKASSRSNGDERRKRARAVDVTISDEGIGIPKEDVSKIFSDFHQLDGSETRSYGGLGLGLAFVRRIVEAHDGTVRVESKPDEGTRLTVSIPAARASTKRA